MSYIHLNFKKISIGFFVALFFIILSFLIGERSNFFKTLIIISAFIFFIYEIKLKYKILSFSLIIILFISIINFNENLIRLYNKKMEWLREIDLNKMTAYMQFPSGEQYLYECKKIKSIME